MLSLDYAYGVPEGHAKLKVEAEDFCVEEQLAFSLSGEGEHLWLWVEKTGQNTDWVVKQLANFMGLTTREMGVAGKKDRHAVTLQWVSCHLPGKADPDFSQFSVPGVKILKAIRHHRKLQTGGLSGNRFSLRLRDVDAEPIILEKRLKQVAEQGVPNYFGEQRFGREMQNLQQASLLFKGEIRPKRHQKSLYLSAARSWLFNLELSERIRQGNWNQAINGDVFQLEGSQKCFVEVLDEQIQQRVNDFDIHPTGLMTGQGRLMSVGQVAELEQQLMMDFPLWQKGLETFGLKQERRALRVMPQSMAWQWETDDRLVVTFGLPAGSYATMVMREVIINIG